MPSLETRIVRLESVTPPFRADGRDPALIELCRDVYGERFDESSVPAGITVNRLLSAIAQQDVRPPVRP